MSDNTDNVAKHFDNTGYPYNRIVQWLAGPVSAGVGLLFSWLAVHQHVVLPASVKNSASVAAVSVVTFAVSAGATYLAHHKWLTNLSHWFFAQQDAATAAVLDNASKPGHTTGQRADTWEPPTPEQEAEARAELGGKRAVVDAPQA